MAIALELIGSLGPRRVRSYQDFKTNDLCLMYQGRSWFIGKPDPAWPTSGQWASNPVYAVPEPSKTY